MFITYVFGYIGLFSGYYGIEFGCYQCQYAWRYACHHVKTKNLCTQLRSSITLLTMHDLILSSLSLTRTFKQVMRQRFFFMDELSIITNHVV